MDELINAGVNFFRRETNPSAKVEELPGWKERQTDVSQPPAGANLGQNTTNTHHACVSENQRGPFSVFLLHNFVRLTIRSAYLLHTNSHIHIHFQRKKVSKVVIEVWREFGGGTVTLFYQWNNLKCGSDQNRGVNLTDVSASQFANAHRNRMWVLLWWRTCAVWRMKTCTEHPTIEKWYSDLTHLWMLLKNSYSTPPNNLHYCTLLTHYAQPWNYKYIEEEDHHSFIHLFLLHLILFRLHSC